MDRHFCFYETESHFFARLNLNSWAEAILLLQPPEDEVPLCLTDILQCGLLGVTGFA
jgi:hypothetical protein